MSAHPGRTPAQRRVLDAIGCGNHSPIMAASTRDTMLRDGLIVQLSDQVDRRGPFAVTFQQFEMPIPIHRQWCAAQASCPEQEEGP